MAASLARTARAEKSVKRSYEGFLATLDNEGLKAHARDMFENMTREQALASIVVHGHSEEIARTWLEVIYGDRQPHA